jgi:hypothetical protein
MAISLLLLSSKAHGFMNRIFKIIYKKLGVCNGFFTRQTDKGVEIFSGHTFLLQHREIMKMGGMLFFQVIASQRVKGST